MIYFLIPSRLAWPFKIYLFLFIIFKTGPCSIAQADLKLIFVLPCAPMRSTSQAYTLSLRVCLILLTFSLALIPVGEHGQGFLQLCCGQHLFWMICSLLCAGE